MKIQYLFAVLLFIISSQVACQKNITKAMKSTTITTEKLNMTALPYHDIPDAPKAYTATNVAARMIDGLGYRFYWATEGLTDNELDFDPGNDNKSPRELMDHFVGLANTILNALENKPNIRPAVAIEADFPAQRKLVLEKLKLSSDLLRAMSDEDLENTKIIFQRGEKQSVFPFWNLLNGQIADAIYHTGQIVAQRRSAGNPISPRVNVFTGITSG